MIPVRVLCGLALSGRRVHAVITDTEGVPLGPFNISGSVFTATVALSECGVPVILFREPTDYRKSHPDSCRNCGKRLKGMDE